MKKIILTVLLTFIFTSQVAAKQNLAVGWELWYPYQYHNKNRELVGLDFDIFNAIVSHAGLNVTYTELPWKRHVHYIKTGQMDVAMGSSFTNEREQFAYFSLPYRKEQVNLFVRNKDINAIKLSNLSELTGSRFMIGIESGYYYGKEFQSLIQDPEFQAHISEVIDLEENIKLLINGHLDGILVDPVTMSSFVKKYRLEGQFSKHSLPIYQADIHIMLSKKSTDIKLLNRINKSISELKQNGELDKLIDKWTRINKGG